MKKRIALVGLILVTSVVSAALHKTLTYTPAGLPTADNGMAEIPVSDVPLTRTLRDVQLADLAERGKATGIYHGSPPVVEKAEWYEDNFFNTLAADKVWHTDTARAEHERKGPIKWDIVPLPQSYTPPSCDQPQPTGYDAESCRIANSLFKDLEQTDPERVATLRESVRRGRDVWFKGTFGNQDLNDIHLARTIGSENVWYPWLDTREREHRFTKWGFINDPDCKQGDESSFWMDICQDPHSSGVLGYRKYFRAPETNDAGDVVFDPRSTPYQEGEQETQRRFQIGHPCVQCHVSFDPTNPPADPNEPEWANLMGLAGNQYINQPLAAFLAATPRENFAVQAIGSARPGSVDTSINPNDFMHNPGTQNNITDFFNKRVFQHKMKDAFTGEIKEAPTFRVLKGGEDTVGDRLALLRVYINIGMCTEECWVPNFPVPGDMIGDESHQTPMGIKACSEDCEAWNYADAKMPHLAQYIHTAGPTYLLKATDVDGKTGSDFVDLEQVPAGRTVFARECARCHSTKLPAESIVADKDALERFYQGHVFGSEEYWQYEFDADTRNSAEFTAKHLTADTQGALRPTQFVKDGVFGQDWLGNDELTPYHEIGTNRCRAMHDNHDAGKIWEEFGSETFRERPVAGVVPKTLNHLIPVLGGKEFGEKTIGGEGSGAGYLRNFSLLSAWATAPFLHNNALGDLTYLPDGAIDYTVAGRIAQYELAMERLLMSDNPEVEPHRPAKITVTTADTKVGAREDGQAMIQFGLDKGTPVAHFASQDPHAPVFMKCEDPIENKGHQFGVDLSAADKKALTEFLKLM